jgi:hypothetical protein
MAGAGAGATGAAAAAAASTYKEVNWKKVSTFDALNEEVIAFLEGKRRETPWHGGPVDEETIPLLGDLIELNKLGFISTEGQPDEYTKGVYRTTKEPYTRIQHGYVVGILDTRSYPLMQLIAQVETDPSVFAALYVYKTGESAIINAPPSETEYILNDRYVLTQYIEKGEGIPYTTLPLNDLEGGASVVLDNVENASLANEIYENGLYITFVHNVDPATATGPSLERKVIRILESMKPKSTRGGRRRKGHKKSMKTRRRRKI